MARNLRILLGLLLVAGVVGVGVFLYLTRPLEAPSQDIQANTQRLERDVESIANSAVFRIDQQGSTVEFNIDEVLMGQDKTVVGSTNQVAGDILVDFDNPAESQVGQIRINARTFRTDDNRRNNAIGRFILQSERDAYEFITFQPTSISGLPQNVSLGDTLQFRLTGDLTVVETTRAVTFDVTVLYASENQITGSAQTTVKYADFGLSIPQVQMVSGVSDDVILKISFTANRVTDEASG